MARLLTSAFACLAALSSAGTAFGAYDPSLLVGETSPSLASSGPVRIFLRTGRRGDDATAVVTVYAPRGYRVELGQAPGTQVGRFVAEVRTRAVGGALQTVEGTIRAENPADHAANSCAPGAHEAVWALEFRLAGTRFRQPVYVDRVSSGGEAAHASARMVVCHAPRDTGLPAEGAVSMPYADLTVRGVFTNPDRQGTYPWNAVFVPYSPGTATPNHALTAQSTAYVSLPSTFAVTAKRQASKRFAVVKACLQEAGSPLRGVRLTLYYGAKSVFGSRRVAVRHTDATGCVVARIRVRKVMVVFASVHVPLRRAAGCTPVLAPRCSDASIFPPPVVFRAVRVRA